MRSKKPPRESPEERAARKQHQQDLETTIPLSSFFVDVSDQQRQQIAQIELDASLQPLPGIFNDPFAEATANVEVTGNSAGTTDAGASASIHANVTVSSDAGSGTTTASAAVSLSTPASSYVSLQLQSSHAVSESVEDEIMGDDGKSLILPNNEELAMLLNDSEKSSDQNPSGNVPMEDDTTPSSNLVIDENSKQVDSPISEDSMVASTSVDQKQDNLFDNIQAPPYVESDEEGASVQCIADLRKNKPVSPVLGHTGTTPPMFPSPTNNLAASQVVIDGSAGSQINQQIGGQFAPGSLDAKIEQFRVNLLQASNYQGSWADQVEQQNAANSQSTTDSQNDSNRSSAAATADSTDVSITGDDGQGSFQQPKTRRPAYRFTPVHIRPAYPNFDALLASLVETHWDFTDLATWLAVHTQHVVINLRQPTCRFAFPFQKDILPAVWFDETKCHLFQGVDELSKMDKIIQTAITSPDNKLKGVYSIRFERVFDDVFPVYAWKGPFPAPPPVAAADAVRCNDMAKWCSISFFDGTTIVFDMFGFPSMPEPVTKLLLNKHYLGFSMKWKVSHLQMQQLWGGPPPAEAKTGWQEVAGIYYVPNTYTVNKQPEILNIVDVDDAYEVFISNNFVSRKYKTYRFPASKYLRLLDVVFDILGIYLPTAFSEIDGRIWDVTLNSHEHPHHQMSDQQIRTLQERGAALLSVGIALTALGCFDNHSVDPGLIGKRPVGANLAHTTVDATQYIRRMVLHNTGVKYIIHNDDAEHPAFCDSARYSTLSADQKANAYRVDRRRDVSIDWLLTNDAYWYWLENFSQQYGRHFPHEEVGNSTIIIRSSYMATDETAEANYWYMRHLSRFNVLPTQQQVKWRCDPFSAPAAVSGQMIWYKSYESSAAVPFLYDLSSTQRTKQQKVMALRAKYSLKGTAPKKNVSAINQDNVPNFGDNTEFPAILPSTAAGGSMVFPQPPALPPVRPKDKEKKQDPLANKSPMLKANVKVPKLVAVTGQPPVKAKDDKKKPNPHANKSLTQKADKDVVAQVVASGKLPSTVAILQNQVPDPVGNPSGTSTPITQNAPDLSTANVSATPSLSAPAATAVDPASGPTATKSKNPSSSESPDGFGFEEQMPPEDEIVFAGAIDVTLDLGTFMTEVVKFYAKHRLPFDEDKLKPSELRKLFALQPLPIYPMLDHFGLYGSREIPTNFNGFNVYYNLAHVLLPIIDESEKMELSFLDRDTNLDEYRLIVHRAQENIQQGWVYHATAVIYQPALPASSSFHNIDGGRCSEKSDLHMVQLYADAVNTVFFQCTSAADLNPNLRQLTNNEFAQICEWLRCSCLDTICHVANKHRKVDKLPLPFPAALYRRQVLTTAQRLKEAQKHFHDADSVLFRQEKESAVAEDDCMIRSSTKKLIKQLDLANILADVEKAKADKLRLQLKSNSRSASKKRKQNPPDDYDALRRSSLDGSANKYSRQDSFNRSDMQQGRGGYARDSPHAYAPHPPPNFLPSNAANAAVVSQNDPPGAYQGNSGQQPTYQGQAARGRGQAARGRNQGQSRGRGAQQQQFRGRGGYGGARGGANP